MTRPAALPGNPNRAQLSSEQIDPVQSAALRIKPDDGDAEIIGPNPGSWNHTGSDEDQRPTAVHRRDRSRPLHAMNLEVATLVVYPRQAFRTVEVAHFSGHSGSRHSVRSSEVDHPLAAQFDRFIVRSAPRPRLWRLPLHKTSLPETAVIAWRELALEGRMSALAPIVTPSTSSRRKTVTGDRS